MLSYNVINRNNSPENNKKLFSSETELKVRFSIEENKCGTHSFSFCNWFVGYTDGDGCFSIYTNVLSNKINLTYKLSQKTDNIQVLYYIKRKLGIGVVRKDKLGMAHFLVRDLKAIINIIIPLFDSYPLQTSKRIDFLKFKECSLVWRDDSLTQSQKILSINNIKDNNKKYFLLSSDISNYILNKYWIVGFIEAEGSFYLVEKEKDKRICHGFGITQKNEELLLCKIRFNLKITAKVRYNKKGFYSLDCTNYKDLKFIKKFFFKTMKSKKALIYRIWARSFRNRGNYLKLKKIKLQLNRVKV